jgi:hypothetical protein
MCPFCWSMLGLIVGSAASTGGSGRGGGESVSPSEGSKRGCFLSLREGTD